LPEFDKDAVRGFLREFKALMKEKAFYVINREDNIRALIDLGINAKIRDYELKSLSVLDYVSGPDPDQTHPGAVWTFGKHIRDRDVYIKLKIVEGELEDNAICISFHPALRHLAYPFKPDAKQ